jgi:hypothetical protein
MMRTIKSQVGTVILSLEAGRLYGEPTRICNLPKHATGHGRARVPQRYWPRKSELCLPWLLASRALGARRWLTGFRPGSWQQGQSNHPTPH